MNIAIEELEKAIELMHLVAHDYRTYSMNFPDYLTREQIEQYHYPCDWQVLDLLYKLKKNAVGVAGAEIAVNIAEEHKQWAEKNFGTNRPYQDPLMGLVEEVGELHHALLKQRQGIRGEYLKHLLEVCDAVGDITLYLMDFCNVYGIDYEVAVRTTWEKVKGRDWKAYPQTGRPPNEKED